MITYKLLRIKGGRLFLLYVEYNREMQLGVWLDARIGEKIDGGHVKGRCGPLALRPRYHSTRIPFTDWIGKKDAEGKLRQRHDTVWCECEVEGRQQKVTDKNGLRELPSRASLPVLRIRD